jgi:hypothetical protein
MIFSIQIWQFHSFSRKILVFPSNFDISIKFSFVVLLKAWCHLLISSLQIGYKLPIKTLLKGSLHEGPNPYPCGIVFGSANGPMFCKWANNWGLYIDVGLIVGPGRTWYPPLPLFTSRPNSLIFLFSPPYIFFLVFFFTKSESTTLI